MFLGFFTFSFGGYSKLRTVLILKSFSYSSFAHLGIPKSLVILSLTRSSLQILAKMIGIEISLLVFHNFYFDLLSEAKVEIVHSIYHKSLSVLIIHFFSIQGKH